MAVAAAAPQRDVRTFALTDLVVGAGPPARPPRAALGEHDPRAIIYSTITAALLWPAPGAIRYDAPAAANRPGRHGVWQRPLERRRLRAAPLLVPWADGSLAETPAPHAPAVVVPIPVEPLRRAAAAAERDIAALTYAANPHKKGLDRVLGAWVGSAARRARSSSWRAPSAARPTPGVRDAGRLRPEDYRALVRRARVFVTAPRREDYGIAQLEALADGCALVTTRGARPVRRAAARPRARPAARAGDDGGLAGALRAALDDAGAATTPSARWPRWRRTATPRSTGPWRRSCCRGSSPRPAADPLSSRAGAARDRSRGSRRCPACDVGLRARASTR